MKLSDEERQYFDCLARAPDFRRNGGRTWLDGGRTAGVWKYGDIHDK